MATQIAIQSAINSLIQDFNGHRIAFPNGQYEGECTAPVVWYLNRLGLNDIPYMANNRADGWGVSFPWQLQELFSHEPFQPGKQYPYGTILMWNSPHIAIVLTCNGSNTVQVFQQNADPNGAPCQMSNRVVNNQFHACTFALVPRVEAPAPPPPPQTVHPYTIKNVDPVRLRTKVDTWQYHLNYDNQPAIDANHGAGRGKGWEFTKVAELYHIPTGRTYYLEPEYSMEDPLGIPADLCEPLPTYQPPAAPIQFPHNDEFYTVYDTLIAYKSANDALNDLNGQGIVKPGSKYYVFNRRVAADNPHNVAVNVTLIKGQPGSWINELKNLPIPRDPVPVVSNVAPPVVANVPVPAPTPIADIASAVVAVEKPQATITVTVESDSPEQIRSSYREYFGGPIECRITRTVSEDHPMVIKNLLDKTKTINITKQRHIKVYGTVVENGMTYAVTRSLHDADMRNKFPNTRDMYAIRVLSHENFSPDLRQLYTLADNVRASVESAWMSFEDIFDKRSGTFDKSRNLVKKIKK